MALSGLSRSVPIVDDMGRPTQEMNLFSEAVARLEPILGEGSPEGVIEARAGRFYIDQNSAPRLWLKVFDALTGDRKQGWESI